MTTGQLRKFFGEIKRIEADVEKYKADVVMLKPLLAYAVGRDKNKLEILQKELKSKSKIVIVDLNEFDYKEFCTDIIYLIVR